MRLRSTKAQAVDPQIPAGHMRPDLVELVLGQMGRKDLFPKDTLKALRQTSHAFKALIDGLFPSLLSKITVHDKEGLKKLLKSPSIIKNMETFTYSGSRAMPVDATTALMAANPSQLKELVLGTAGLAFDRIVDSYLPDLTYLSLNDLHKKTKALEWLCHAEYIWPPQELSLHTDYRIEHAILVPALKRLPQLRKLILRGKLHSSGHSSDSERFEENSFPELETLELNINQPGHLGLLWKAKLPSLLHLRLKFDYVAGYSQKYLGKLDAPWIQQLQSLEFSNRHEWLTFSGSASILTAFHSGALKTLVIQNWLLQDDLFEEDDFFEKDDLFEDVHLPGLRSLTLQMDYPDVHPTHPPASVIAALATASLPLLSKLDVEGGGYTLAMGDINLLSSFSQLSSLSLMRLKMQEGDWAWFIASILPRLEEFATSDNGFITSIRALDLSTASTATWPLMHKLVLEQSVLVDILPLAPRFPSITMLGMRSVNGCEDHDNGPQPSEPTAYEVILDAAINEHAWPDLTSLEFLGRGWLKNGDLPVLKKAWPRAIVSFRH